MSIVDDDEDYSRWDDSIALVLERYRGGYVPWDRATLPENLVEATEHAPIREWIVEAYQSLGLTLRLWLRERSDNPIHDGAVVNFFFPEKDYRSNHWTFEESLIHEVCHAIVWDAQGRIGTNQWGLGSYFSSTGPGRTIEAMVTILHSFLLAEHGDEEEARRMIRDDLGSQSVTTPADFIEAVRIWERYKARREVQA